MLNYLIESNLNISECNNNIAQNTTITINLLIDSIEKALDLGFYIQAIQMLDNLKKLCNIKSCTGCETIKCNSCSKFKQLV